MSLLSTILIFMITAVSISSTQQTKVISPPEFANQGKDDLPFSPGILVGDTLYVSGEIGFDLHTGQIPKDFDAEVKACLDNIGIVPKSSWNGLLGRGLGAGLPHRYNPVQTYERGLRFRFQNAATGARYGRCRGARRAHCSCRDRGHRAAAGLEELSAKKICCNRVQAIRIKL